MFCNDPINLSWGVVEAYVEAYIINKKDPIFSVLESLKKGNNFVIIPPTYYARWPQLNQPN